ncbi:hypothetical protein SAMN05421595_2849 [Austwickia chelonae]|uniref:DUF4298 domain-containing protein n=1 Tax=Austwickia chelonae NBRC 105200 TaxID=1184607 RepID=K6VTC3_9MICO|nr:hypothetical protein [Austwickia chelonae]GAB78570.1 hypothetical protein AUCHE_12_00150 [Austwickia chelonae NBRC 105200]SEW40908.1 hypothetical protein SAMN05421595_2849 [Austwickia chelonae]
MTKSDDARTALNQAQCLLEEVTCDIDRFDETLSWLAMAIDRVHRLDEYHRGPGQADLEAVLAADPAAVTPAVAGEDAVWECVTEFDERMLRLLRVVTARVTAAVDDPA